LTPTFGRRVTLKLVQPNVKRLAKLVLLAASISWLLDVGARVLIVHFGLRPASAPLGAPLGASADGKLAVLWPAPAFSALDQSGQVVTEKTLANHVWIADFIFTRCTTACPLISAKMLLLRQAIERPDIRFVSFSVDPEFDTPAVLAGYAIRWHGDPRWLLLSGPLSQVARVAAAMKVGFEHTSDPENPIIHTTFFFLIDAAGRVRGIYDSLDDEALKRLVNDARALDGGRPAREPGTVSVVMPGDDASSHAETRGKVLFDSAGCAACHADARIAPSLAGISGSPVRLEGGATAVADPVYLRESILDPSASVVDGYQALMPSYRDHLSAGQVADLIVYMQSLHVPDTTARNVAQPPTSAKATDPVCGMKVVATDQSPHGTYGGRTYYFCSDSCRERFEKAPKKYLAGGS
jgi:protein SCO1/2